MSDKKLVMSPLIKRYYDTWLRSPTPFGHPLDERRYYQFVKACLRYGKTASHGGIWLRKHLQQDLPKQFKDPEYIENSIRKAITIFQTCRDFQSTPFPDRATDGRGY